MTDDLQHAGERVKRLRGVCDSLQTQLNTAIVGQGDVIRLVLRHAMGLAVLGLLLGVAGAFGLTQLLQSLLFGIGDRDPVTLAVVFILLGLVALAACLLPARRAARVDPIIALRAE